MSARDALTFPLVAGGALTALWAAFRYFDKDSVNAVLAVYFVTASAFAVGSMVSWGVTALLGQSGKSQRVLFPLRVPGLLEANLTAVDAASLVVGLAVGVAEVVWQDWRVTNLVASCLAVQGIARMSVGRFSTAAILLTGLFAYDIFMVFGTGMMQSVATKVRGPILLKIPRPLLDPAAADLPFGILGLGDIVLPGAFLALVLRFDATLASVWRSAAEANRPRTAAAVSTDDHDDHDDHDARTSSISSKGIRRRPVAPQSQSQESEPSADTPSSSPSSSPPPLHVIYLEPGAPGGPAETLGFEKPVYGATLLAYAAGLVATIVSMHLMDHAQPALLFLVPAVLLGSLAGAWRAQVLSQLVDYSEASEEVKAVEAGVVSATVGEDVPTPHEKQ
jgi:minor histocompatibility antigen H13